MMIVLEGPDMTGKSEIAKGLALRLHHSYFKNSDEWSTDLRTPEYFKNVLKYGGPFLTSFLCQVKPNVIMDRYYPSEWVYSKAFNRLTYETILTKIDESFAAAGGKIVLCRRKNYEGIKDDLHDYIDSSFLEKLDVLYEKFTSWTRCPVLTLWVDDEDLERELNDVAEWLKQR